MLHRIKLVLAGVALVAGTVGFAALAFSQARPVTNKSRSLTPAVFLAQPIPDSVPNAEQVRRGQYLVRAGDCASCHTPDGGPPFSGNFPLRTPFGIIYSTNLTSDATGVGQISPETFYRVLHNGVGPKGAQVYPAMPYNYFTRISRADSDAILAYLKTTPPVNSRRSANKLPFPLNIRFLVKGWNLFFFRPGEFTPTSGKSAEWNRGAYLVTGPGHCGGCHTPKNFLAGDKNDQALRGGDLDNWIAPDLTANRRTGLGSWSVDEVVQYLKAGRNARGNAGGPMAEVVSYSTSLMSDADLRAMAVYLKDQAASPSPSVRTADAGAMRRGAAIYSDACASCHMLGGIGQPGYFAPLVGNAVAQQSNPAGVIHMVLAGSRTAPTASRPSPLTMPSFAWKLNDRQIADVTTYVRNSWGNKAPQVSARTVAGLRKDLDLTRVHLTDNSGDHPPATAKTAASGPPPRNP